MNQRTELIELAEAYAAHVGITHWAVSMRIFKKGDFFGKLMKGSDCRTRTAVRANQWLSDNWPSDLAWPGNIPRPTPTEEAA